MLMSKNAIVRIGFLAAVSLASSVCWAIPWDRDDFFVTGGGTSGSNRDISVYDSDFTFKGYLEDSLPSYVGGFDFDSSGNLVAVLQNQEVRVYSPSGEQVSGFSHPELGTPLDIKVGPTGNYFVATQGNYFDFDDPNFSPTGLVEFTPTGNVVTRFDIAESRAVAVLNNDEVWAGGSSTVGKLEVFSSTAGELTHSILLSEPQLRPLSMQYSAITDTVLISSSFHAPIELRSDGTFLRSFEGGSVGGLGITRGPNGDVFTADASDLNRIFRWTADGEFLGAQRISSVYRGISVIAWAGNSIPEPSTFLLSAILAVAGLAHRRFARGVAA